MTDSRDGSRASMRDTGRGHRGTRVQGCKGTWTSARGTNVQAGWAVSATDDFRFSGKCGRQHSDAPIDALELPHAHVLVDDVDAAHLPLRGAFERRRLERSARVDVVLDVGEVVEDEGLA